MEVGGGGGGGRRRLSRETSPDRARVVYMHQPRVRPFRKVQIVYYLCRNGHLEHPHIMELSHLPNQHLRLKDVIDRLTVLRGRGMTSLFSWSCKRSYKNGYVWNDLAENDVIYPAEGAEYVLKGSEIFQGCAERFQQLQLSNSKPKLLAIPQNSRRVELEEEEEEIEEEEEEEVQEEEEIEEEEEKDGNHTANNNSSCCNTPYTRCSRGVSTDEIDQGGDLTKTRDHHPTELPLDDASPPSSSSSEKAATNQPNTSYRFEDGDPGLPRNSVLLQLISCGSVAVKGRSNGLLKAVSSSNSPPCGISIGSSGRKSGSLHKGVLSRLATRSVEEDELKYISENPRFGNPQLEEKEYFSGSIVESITESSRVSSEPSLKKSSSYNEERSSKCGIGEELEVGDERKGVKGKCIPSRKKSCKQQVQLQQQQTRK